MKNPTAVAFRWVGAALFAAIACATAAAAADEPEKPRPEHREQRRSDQPQARHPERSTPSERQANPQPRSGQHVPQAAPAEAPRQAPQQAPARVQHPSTPQERRPAPAVPATAAPERRPDRTPPQPRNAGVIHNPPADRTVTRSSMGTRTVVVQRPDRTVVVGRAPGRGYVQRPVVISNTTYVQRTYVHNNVVATRVYRPYSYRGATFAVYTPVRYYPPHFYAWTYSPWRTPVHYTWGWRRDPWYGYYGGYFAPYPVYASPALWLTDYVIASTLQAAYMERMAEQRAAANNAYAAGVVPLSPEVKQAIAVEVQQQIQYERNEAQNQGSVGPANGLPPTLTDNRRHLFVVDRGLDVANLSMGGQMCPISEGDVLQMDGPAPGDADAANVVVVSAKPGSCVRGSTLSVYLADLTEMQNQLRQTVDMGMEELRAKQGQGGLPALPADVAAAPIAASFAAQLPPPDPNAARELQQEYADPPPPQSTAAPQASSTGVISVDGGPTPTISVGQSIEQVTGILGQPKSIADLGSKKVYLFKDLKVTFIDGLVTDVQ